LGGSKKLTEINRLDKKINEIVKSSKQFPNLKKDLITFYWTRKDSKIMSKLIETFAEDGDIIFDPFLGSAPILYSLDESDKNLRFIGSEINEMPLAFIKFNLKKLDLKDLKKIRENFLVFYEKYKNLYKYESPLYLEDCMVSKIILDRHEEEFIPKEFILEGKEKLVIDKTDKDLFSKFTLKYQNRCNELNIHRDVDLMPNSRIAIKDGMKMSDLFNPINFFILNEYFKRFKNDDSMIALMSSVLHLCRLTDLKSQSQFPYWIPKKNVVERNILLLLKKRIEKVLKEKKDNTLQLELVSDFKKLDKGKSVYFLNKPSQTITEAEIPNDSVDLVITDPPYFDQVAYSEYLKIWEFFCGYKSLLKDELIHSNRSKVASDEKLYLENLYLCFSLVAKKLKKNGLAIVFFKDSKPKNIHLFIEQMERSGLKFIQTCHLQKKKFTYKQNTTQDTTVTGECLFFFKKAEVKTINERKSKILDKIQAKLEIEKTLLDFIKKYSLKNSEASLGELYDGGLILKLYKEDV
jgi:DNA modification methylase